MMHLMDDATCVRPTRMRASVAMVAWQIDEDGYDIRPGDRISWLVLEIPERSIYASTAARPVRYLFDVYDLSQPHEVGGELRYAHVEGAVAAVERILHRGPARQPEDCAVPAASTREATHVRSEGAIVTFDVDATVERIVPTPETPRFDHRRAGKRVGESW